MRRSPTALAILAVALLAVALTGCSKQQGGPLIGPPGYSTTDLTALELQSPFPLNVPTDLPVGFWFSSGVITPDPQGNGPNTKVTMSFTRGDKTSLQVTESRGEILFAGQTTQVELGGVKGQMQRASRPDGSDVISILFRAKDLSHLIVAQGVPEAELLQVAESLCENRKPPIPL